MPTTHPTEAYSRMTEYYAHRIEGKPVEERHRLEEHLKRTAELAKSFAQEFGCVEWGYMAGLLHIPKKCSNDY